MKRKVVAVIVLILCTGCATIPPDLSKQRQRDASRLHLPPDIRLAQEGWPEARWWMHYHDAQLDKLVEQALEDSPSLAMVQTRVKSAEAKWALAAAAMGLDVEASGQVTRQRFPGHDIYPPPWAGTWQTQSTLQFSGSLNMDWWGRNRHAVAAALGEHYASRADLAMAEQSLAAAVAQAYFIWQSDQARCRLLKQQIDRQQQLVVLTKQRRAAGLETVSAQHIVEGNAAYLRNQLALQEANIQRDREMLRALIGEGQAPSATLSIVPLPGATGRLPATLGLNLLARRPDLQAARWRVEAAIHREASDKAAFYPNINLISFFGYSLIGNEHLVSSANRNPGVGVAFALPLFDSGRLQAQLEGSRAQRDNAIAQYNQALINAVQDVADQGITLQGLARQMEAQRVTLEAAEAVVQNYTQRMAQGLLERSMVLQAELSLLAQQEAQLQLKRAVLLADVALIKALGGGYLTPDSMQGHL